MDFSNYVFRASSMPKIMRGATRPGLTPKQEEKLSELYERQAGKFLSPKTGKPLGFTKNHQQELESLEILAEQKPKFTNKEAIRTLQDIFIQEVYGRRRIITAKPLEKGTIAEDETIDLYSLAEAKFYVKNEEELTNGFVKGTVDMKVFDKDKKNVIRVDDAKSSFDIWTFTAMTQEEAKSQYYWQIVSYADIDNVDRGRLVYGLPSMPEQMLMDEKYRMSYKYPFTTWEDEQIEEYLRTNYTYEDIPVEQRVKIFEFSIPQEDKDLLRYYVNLGREFLQNMYDNLPRKV